MSSTKQVETKKYRSGIPCTEKSLAEYNKTWKDMDECFEGLDKQKKPKKK